MAAKPFGLRVFANYQSAQVYRGALIWPEGSGLAGPGLVFFERLYIFGPNIYFSPTKRGDSFQWRSGLSFVDDDDPPLSFGDHVEDYRNRRKSSLEAYVTGSYNFGWRKKFRIGGYLGREVKEGLGLHTEAFVGVPFLPFTTLTSRISFSEKGMSRYIYGPESISGFGYSSLNLNAVFPFVPWDGIIMGGWTRSWVLKGINQQADYIRGDSIQDVVYLRLFWNAL